MNTHCCSSRSCGSSRNQEKAICSCSCVWGIINSKIQIGCSYLQEFHSQPHLDSGLTFHRKLTVYPRTSPYSTLPPPSKYLECNDPGRCGHEPPASDPSSLGCSASTGPRRARAAPLSVTCQGSQQFDGFHDFLLFNDTEKGKAWNHDRAMAMMPSHSSMCICHYPPTPAP